MNFPGHPRVSCTLAGPPGPRPPRPSGQRCFAGLALGLQTGPGCLLLEVEAQLEVGALQCCDQAEARHAGRREGPGIFLPPRHVPPLVSQSPHPRVLPVLCALGGLGACWGPSVSFCASPCQYCPCLHACPGCASVQSVSVVCACRSGCQPECCAGREDVECWLQALHGPHPIGQSAVHQPSGESR